MLKGKRILITGGSGTWGQELTRECLRRKAGEIIIFSRNESAQVAMKQQFAADKFSIRFILGDIRDAQAIKEACKGVHIVFHAAALKHVTKCEEQPREAVLTNITGTQNVIEACIANDVHTCINISTDKVCHASCFYGHTKAIAESLITEANNRTRQTDFFSVRSGNIFGSKGSVIDLWKEQVKHKGEIILTSPSMTRFFISVKEAVKLTLKAIDISDRGEVFVLKMPAFDMHSMAETFLEHFGNKKSKIKIIGALRGERLHEYLFTHHEICRMIDLKEFYVVYPSIRIQTTNYPIADDKLKEYWLSDGYCSNDHIYHSNKILLNDLFESL